MGLSWLLVLISLVWRRSQQREAVAITKVSPSVRGVITDVGVFAFWEFWLRLVSVPFFFLLTCQPQEANNYLVGLWFVWSQVYWCDCVVNLEDFSTGLQLENISDVACLSGSLWLRAWPANWGLVLPELVSEDFKMWQNLIWVAEVSVQNPETLGKEGFFLWERKTKTFSTEPK